MKILLVSAHVRQSSLTKAVADTFTVAASANGHQVETADLVVERFDPVLREADEPDWANSSKKYSDAVQREMQRVERNEATVLVFPVWWWSMPALLKGWIDRVWNHGWGYGDRFYPHKRVWMIAVAGVLKPAYEKRGYDAAMRTQLEVGILEYCHVEDPRLAVLYGSIEGDPYPLQILAEARRLGFEF